MQKASEIIPKGASISWGGSMTLIEVGIMTAIQNGNYKIINRDIATNSEEQNRIYGKICCNKAFKNSKSH